MIHGNQIENPITHRYIETINRTIHQNYKSHSLVNRPKTINFSNVKMCNDGKIELEIFRKIKRIFNKLTFTPNCHVVSHWDDRNKITTILVFELTVASRQRMTVQKECGSQWRPTDVCTWWPHSGRLTREGRR